MTTHELHHDSEFPLVPLMHQVAAGSSIRRTQSRAETSRSTSPARVPTITRHPSHMLALPTPDLVGSIASGAHYAGALSPTHPHFDSKHSAHHRRSASLNADDPAIERSYADVMVDFEEVSVMR